MISFVKLVNRIKNKIYIEADLWLWARSVRPIKRTTKPAVKRKVLFCDLMTMTSTAKVQALYGAMLRYKGYQMYILLTAPAPFIEKIYKAVTTDVQFVYLNPRLQNDQEAKAEEIISGLKSSEDILSLEYKNCRIGKNALSYAVRKLRVGNLDLKNETHRVCFKGVLSQSLDVAEIAETCVKEISPDIAVFLERGYTPLGEFFDTCIAQGIRTVQWLGSPQSDSLLFKGYTKENQSYHPLALSDETWEKLNGPESSWSEEKKQAVLSKMISHYESGSWYNRQQLQSGKKIQTSDIILKALGLDPNKKTAVVFSHIFYDATFFYGDSIYPDYKKWLIETVRYAIQNDNLNWIVKVHPVNVWRSEMDGLKMDQLEVAALQEELGELPDHIKIMPANTDVNTFSLFEFADYGLTVRGTIGMEFPCFGIPIITAGSGRYNGRGFTIDPHSEEEYKETLLNLHQVEKLDDKTVDLACRYAYGTFFLRPIKMESYILDFHANTFGSELLKQNTFVHKETASDWLKSSDLTQISEWIISGQDDFIMERH